MDSITGTGALESKQPSQVGIPVHFAQVINPVRLTRLSECYRLSASLELFPADLRAVLFVLIKYHFPFSTLSPAFRRGGEFVLSGLLAYLAQRWPGCRILGPCMTSCHVISRSLAALPSTGSRKQSKYGRAKAGSGWYQIQRDVTYPGSGFQMSIMHSKTAIGRATNDGKGLDNKGKPGALIICCPFMELRRKPCFSQV